MLHAHNVLAKSNQGGIETELYSYLAQLPAKAKSNQGGIETALAHERIVLALKAKSNQGGIETGLSSRQVRCARTRQNRTKVGLKPAVLRGIAAPPCSGKIEPRWD